MKTLILIAILALVGCEVPDKGKTGVYINANDTMSELCVKGIALTNEYSGLMKRSLALNNVAGGLMYIEIQKSKAELDILLKDACGIEVPDKGTML